MSSRQHRPHLPLRMLWTGTLGLACVAACARMVPPTGGPEDKEKPRVIAREPDSAAVKVALDAPLRLVFSESMNRSSVRDWLRVAPWPGKLDCRWDSTCMTCRPERGWRPDAVHTVVLGIEAVDGRRNALARPLEFAFTTGESLPAGTLTGVVRTRALKAQGVPVCLFAWPEAGIPAPGAGAGLAPDPRDALGIAETGADGRFRLQHIARDRGYLLGVLWDESRNRLYDPDVDLWAFYPEPARAVSAVPAQADSAAQATAPAPRDAAAGPSVEPDSATVADSALAVGYEIYLVYPDEPGDIAGVVTDSACAGFVPPGVYRARADSLKRILTGEVDAMGFGGGQDSAAVVALTPAERESLQVALARTDALLAVAAGDSLRCSGSIWVLAAADGDTSSAADTRTVGSYELSGVPPGIYRISAFRDLNGDDEQGSEEPRGAFLAPVEVGPGRRVAGVDFPLVVPSPPEAPR